MKTKSFLVAASILLAITHSAFAQTNTCNDEVKKTKSMYDECMKMDMATSGYAECLKGHDAQRGKAEQACRAIAAQETCNTEKEKTKVIYDECMKMGMATNDYTMCIEKHNTQRVKAEQLCRAAAVIKCEDEKNKAEELCLTISAQAPPPAKATVAPPNSALDPTQCIGARCASAAVVLASATMSVAQALRESSLPGGCLADFTNLLERDGFSMANFVKELPPAVAKVKAQMKSPFPFGKPKDNDKTSVGLTVGCIKALPESPAEIQSLLKNISLKAGLSFAANVAASAIESAGDDYDDDEGDEYYYDPKKLDREASVVESDDHDKGYKKGKEVSKTTFGLSLIAITSLIITIILLAN